MNTKCAVFVFYFARARGSVCVSRADILRGYFRRQRGNGFAASVAFSRKAVLMRKGLVQADAKAETFFAPRGRGEVFEMSALYQYMCDSVIYAIKMRGDKRALTVRVQQRSPHACAEKFSANFFRDRDFFAFAAQGKSF